MSLANSCALLGVPVDIGAGVAGAAEGPDALRRAGIAEALRALGRPVADLGVARPLPVPVRHHPNPALHHLTEAAGWISGLGAAARQAGEAHALPIFMGGDHLISAATVPAMARRAAQRRRPFFVVWLDAHPDLHDLDSSESGNLHGVPVAYFTGRQGFDAFPRLEAAVAPANVCMIGLRSVDDAEARRISDGDFIAHPMEEVSERGAAAVLAPFLDRVAQVGGTLHVSLDTDFLDPAIAPGVGTAVPGGANRADAESIMAILRRSGLVSSLDIVELNPTLDPAGGTAALLVDLAAGLIGRPVSVRNTGT